MKVKKHNSATRYGIISVWCHILLPDGAHYYYVRLKCINFGLTEVSRNYIFCQNPNTVFRFEGFQIKFVHFAFGKDTDPKLEELLQKHTCKQRTVSGSKCTKYICWEEQSLFSILSAEIDFQCHFILKKVGFIRR